MNVVFLLFLVYLTALLESPNI